jgi:hypothetical protein
MPGHARTLGARHPIGGSGGLVGAVGPQVPSDGVSTRALIVAALLCGLLILVAFTVQLLLVL